MRALDFRLPLFATAAALMLISVPAVGLDSGLALTGTVTDRFNNPVPVGLATLSSLDRVLQTHVSAGGQFRFENVPRGVYDLDIKTYGFARQKVSVDLSGAEAPPLTIVLRGPTVPDPDEGCGPQDSIVYSAFDSTTPRLAGTVRSDDRKRKPLPRAEVTLARVDDPRITAHSRSDDHGRFQFESLAAGRYNLRISLNGYLLPEPRQILMPRENNVVGDVSLSRDDKRVVICQ